MNLSTKCPSLQYCLPICALLAHGYLKIIHDLYKEPYEVPYEGVPKLVYDKVFKRTLEQIYLLTNKCAQIIE